jgi:hypothetical protein
VPEPDAAPLLRRWIALVAALAALYACGRNGPLAGPPLDPQRLAAWAGRRQPPEMAVAVGRLCGLAAGSYLLLLLSLALLAGLTGRARAGRLAIRLVPRSLRPMLALTTATVALGVTTSLAGSASAAPHAGPPGHTAAPTPGAADPRGQPTAPPPGPPVLWRVPSSPPAAPLLRRVPPTTTVPATTIPTTPLPTTPLPTTPLPTTPVPTTAVPTTAVPTTAVPSTTTPDGTTPDDPPPPDPPRPTDPSSERGSPPSDPSPGRVTTPLPSTLPHSGASTPVRPTTGHPSPTHRRRAPGTQPPVSVRYVVQPGDSFWSIAMTRVEAAGPDPAIGRVASYWWMLVQANRADLPVPGNPDLLFPGDTVELPPLPETGA